MLGDDTGLCCDDVIGDAWCKSGTGVRIFCAGDNGEEKCCKVNSPCFPKVPLELIDLPPLNL